MSCKAEIAGREPKAVDVEAGKTYKWCSCGKSARQPFCDGSHKGSEFTPVTYVAEKTETVYFCMCKQTTRRPMCDGRHSKI